MNVELKQSKVKAEQKEHEHEHDVLFDVGVELDSAHLSLFTI